MINRKKIFISLICMVGVFVFLSIVFPKIVGVDNLEPNTLDKYTRTVITKYDGTRKSFSTNSFELTDEGDQIDLFVKLPEELKSTNQVLMLNVYHCAVEVKYNNQILFEYGSDLYKANKLIGNVMVRAEIPEEAWGNEINVHLICNENNAFSKIEGITLINNANSYKYGLIAEPLVFYLFLAIIVCSFAALFAILIFGKWKKSARYGVYISTFTISVSIWLLCYNKMSYLLFANPRVSADIEYISLLFCPVPLSLYCTEIESGKIAKKIYTGFTIIFCTLFWVSTITNYAGGPHYNDYLLCYHSLMALSATGIIVLFIVDRGNINLAKTLTKYGVIAVLISAIVDIARYQITKFVPNSKYFFSFSVIPIGVIILVFFLLAGLWQFIKADNLGDSERQRLTKLAYTDLMTGLSNRAECDNKIKDIEKKKTTNYSIVFLDLNNLKTANDEHGHQMGDAYIIEVAKAIDKSFENVFKGRYGGDEFIIIAEGRKQKYLNYYLSMFENIINNINESKIYPFTLGVPKGVAVSNRKKTLTIHEAIEIADNKMYENKMQMKKA